MSDPACTIDVPVLVNRKTVHFQASSDAFVLHFTAKKEDVVIKRSELSSLLYLKDQLRLAMCFETPRLVVPGTKRAVSSVVLQQIDLNDKAVEIVGCQLATDFMQTACGQKTVSHNPQIAIWTDKMCSVISDVQNVVLQRTKGGMKTFDAHIIPANNLLPVVTVELLPHDCLEFWRSQYGQKIVDQGADPISSHTLEQARKDPHGLQTLYMSASDSGDDVMSSDESYCNSDQQYSSESDVGDITNSDNDDELDQFASDCSSSQLSEIDSDCTSYSEDSQHHSQDSDIFSED